MIICFIIVTFIAFGLIHRMYQTTLRAEIFIHGRNLEREIWNSAAGAFQPYFFVIEAGRTISEETTEDFLRKRIEGLSRLYGPGGEYSSLIFSAGYIAGGESEAAECYDFQSGEWSVCQGVGLDDVRFGWNLLNIEKEGQRETFLAFRKEDSGFAAFFRLDLERLRADRIEPAVSEELPEYSIDWVKENDFEKFFRGAEQAFIPEEYFFNPFRVIFAGNGEDIPLYVPVSGLHSIRKFTGRLSIGAPEGDEPDPPWPMKDDDFYIIAIRHQNGSYFHTIERDAAVAFFQSVIVLALISSSFMLLFIQFDRLRMMRRKEREFVASVTHELRTPLTVIQSAADNISSGIVRAGKLATYGNLIADQAGRLGKMIEEILMFSRIEERKQKPPEPVPISFSRLIAELKTTLDAIASAGGVSLDWDAASLPPRCLGDLQTVKLVTENLVSNAVYHAYGTEKGVVRIKMRFRIPGTLSVTVEDEGRGIDARQQKMIFQPFYRDPVSRERQEKGSGLGLFIARRKAEIAGGSLRLQSPYDGIDGSRRRGCRFTLELPCKNITEN